MCLAQGHKVATPVRFEHAAPRSQVKHSTTEPLRSSSADDKVVTSGDRILKVTAEPTLVDTTVSSDTAEVAVAGNLEEKK